MPVASTSAFSSVSANSGASAVRRVRVLSLSGVFPNRKEPNHGVFVRARLQHLALLCDVEVVAPVGLLDHANLGRNWRATKGIPYEREDGEIHVRHPRWFYPPWGSWLNGVLLYLQMLPLFWQLRRLGEEKAFDLIDSHFLYPDGIAACLLSLTLGIPFFVTLRGNELSHGRKPLVRRFMRLAVRRASRVIAVSEELRQFAVSLGAPPANTRVIANGVDSQIFHPRPQQECREKLNIAPGTKLIVSIGQLILGKGHHHVIEAVHRLREQGVPVQCAIIGAPGRHEPCEPELRRLTAQLALGDAVRFVGPVPQVDMPEWMSAADVLCLASRREGWPNVVHEALATGTPVVSTEVGAIRELIPSEEYGLVAPVGDQAALERALADALARSWDRPAIAEWGARRSWSAAAQQVAAEIYEVLKRPSPHGS